MIFDSEYCFANISAMKAHIFMKFDTYGHKLVKNYKKINEYPHTNERTQGTTSAMLPFLTYSAIYPCQSNLPACFL